MAVILNCTWQPGHVYVISFRPTLNWRQGDKPENDFVPLTRSAKFIIFPSDFPLHYLLRYHFRSLEHVWLDNTAQEQP